MLFGHVSVLAWGAECSAVLADVSVLLMELCAQLCGLLDGHVPAQGVNAFMYFDPKLLIGQA